MIGHVAARAYLERELPTASVLFGPPSVGKWTMALHLADHHRVHTMDRWLVEHSMTVDTVHLITRFASRSPQGAFKLIIARIDDAKGRALNAMLKTLEEPPPRVKFLLTCCGRPKDTILSRCEPFELGSLNVQDLQDVYRQQGYSAPRAQQAAHHARGSVKRGYGFEQAADHRGHVVAMLKAVLTGDKDGFAASFTTWDANHSELLTTLLTECLTRRWTTFSEADAAGLCHDRRKLWQMTAALMRFQVARPRLGVRAALEPFLAHR